MQFENFILIQKQKKWDCILFEIAIFVVGYFESCFFSGGPLWKSTNKNQISIYINNISFDRFQFHARWSKKKFINLFCAVIFADISESDAVDHGKFRILIYFI